MAAIDYPATLSVDYPDGKRDRLTCFFRILTIIPIAIVIGLLVQGTGLIVLPVLLLILFRQKYPKWWFSWNLELARFYYRVYAYFCLLLDEYPSTDEEQSVHLEIDFPDVKKDLHRGMPIVKWILAIPHYIVLYCLFIAVFVVSVIAWFAILFTGKYPRGLWDFVVSVIRWAVRVYAYAFLLVTDKYPPFALD